MMDGRLRNVTTTHAHAISVHRKVDQRGVSLVEIMTSAVLLMVALHLLALKLALYALAIRSISDKRENRPNTLN